MSTELQFREFLTQLKNFQAVDPELQAQRELENNNNPSILQFRHDLAQGQEAQQALQLFGDQFIKSEKKEEKGFLDKIASFFGIDEEEEDMFAGIRAYDELIPRANINGTLKEYELMQKAFSEVA